MFYGRYEKHNIYTYDDTVLQNGGNQRCIQCCNFVGSFWVSHLSQDVYRTDDDDITLKTFTNHAPPRNGVIFQVDVMEEMNKAGDSGNLDNN